MSAWTRSDAYELMIGRYRLHYKGAGGSGRLEAAGDFGTLLEAQAEAARWVTWSEVTYSAEAAWQVWVVQYGRFVSVNDETGEVER